MVELKKDALKDVTTLSKTAPETLVKTKEVLNQAVARLVRSAYRSSSSTLVHAWTWLYGMAS